MDSGAIAHDYLHMQVKINKIEEYSTFFLPNQFLTVSSSEIPKTAKETLNGR